MIPLDLTRAERRAYLRALATTHSIRVRVAVLNMEHDRLASLDHAILDGQVNVDLRGEVTRSATISFLDAGRTMSFDSDSPADGALFANRMLRIVYGVRSDQMGSWVNVPIFTGPIIKVDRDGDVVTVEAHGKESLARSPGWKALTVKKGTDKVVAIKRIMRTLTGEHRFAFPDLTARLPKDLSLGRRSVPWDAAKAVARSMNRQLYYDGAGVLRLRAWPQNSLYTFRTGTGGTVLSEPQISFSADNLRNVVQVRGGKPRGAKTGAGTKPKRVPSVSYVAAASSRHPFSPQRLGRKGVPRYLPEFIDDEAIRSVREAERIAKRVLSQRLRQAVEVTFDALPAPHLDAGDIVRIKSDEMVMTFRLEQFSIPLSSSGTMSVGFLRKVSKVGRRNRK